MVVHNEMPADVLQQASNETKSSARVPPVGGKVTTKTQSDASERAGRLPLGTGALRASLSEGATCCAPAEDVDAMTEAEIQALKERFPMLCWCQEEKARAGLCKMTRGGHRGQLPLSSRLLWVGPIFGWFALKYMKLGYMNKFYTDDYPQASLGIIAFSSVLSVLIDAFTDPRMASWTDNLRSPYGRRRPFVFASVFFVPVAFVLAWTPGVVSSGVSASVWFGAFHIVYKLADTLLLIPHDAWGAQLTPNYAETTAVWTTKEVVANIGVLFGIAIVPFFFVTAQCTGTPDTGCVEFPVIALIFGGVFAASAFALAWRGREPPLPRSSREAESFSAEDTIPTLISTFLNKPFRILLVTDVVKAVGQDIPFNIMPYMTAWVLGEKCVSASNAFQYLVLSSIVAGLLHVPVWSLLVKRTSKYFANLVFNVLLGVASVSMVTLGSDNGDCVRTYQTFGLVILFGAVYGGTFLVNSLLSDIVDYDELLTGGLRREASYYMAVQFVPKFMSIPGECLPFLGMAYLGYTRPLKGQFKVACGAEEGLGDAFCHMSYANETLGGSWCSDTKTCQDLLDRGASFVCNDALKECGVAQNEGVRTLLLLCYSLIPAMFVLCGVVALCCYPREARGGKGHARVVQAIAKLRRGEPVEDPWRPGSIVYPAEPPTRHTGALSYFFPHELKRCVQQEASDYIASGAADTSSLWKPPCVWMCVAAFVLIPLGSVGISAGLEGLGDDLGASVSPLGLMLVGVGAVTLWFHGQRFRAARYLCGARVTRAEVIAQYNALAPFVGSARLVVRSTLTE